MCERGERMCERGEWVCERGEWVCERGEWDVVVAVLLAVLLMMICTHIRSMADSSDTAK